MQQSNEAIVVAGDMSGNIFSIPVNVNQIYLYSIQVVWTGTPVGNFTVEASDDPGTDQLGTGVVNWTTMANSQIPTLGDSGDWLFRGLNVSEKWVRLKYTAGSSSGILNARFNAKGV